MKGITGFQNYEMKAYNYLNDIFIRIDAYINSLQTDIEYDPTIFSRMLKFVTDAFQEHFRDSGKHEYTMTPPLEVKVALHVARFSVFRFSKMIKAFKHKNSLRSRVESSRQETEILFNGICTAKANEVIVSNVFCLEIKPLIQEKIERKLSLFIPKEIAHHFEYRKYPLMKAILKDLAEHDDFELFMQYVSCCEAYTTLWITEFTKLHLCTFIEKGKTRFTTFALDELRKMISEVKCSVENASCVPDPPRSISEWIVKFKDNMKEHSLNFSREPFQSIKALVISDFDDLASLIKDQIEGIEQELAEVFQKSNMESLSWKEPTPYQVIMDKLWGCPQTCPWCKEPCSAASKDDNHNHRCIQHRPQGVNGYHVIESKRLVLESCNYDITSNSTLRCGNWCNCPTKDPSVKHPYKEYKKYMPTWDITPSSEISKYWTWFIGKFGKTLADYHELILYDVPEDWKNLTKEDAIMSLSEFD